MIKKIFLTVNLLLFIALSVSAKDIRFVQVAESMYTSGNDTLLKKCVDDINTLKDVDFVVFTGDNISNAKKENLKNFLKIARNLEAPVYIILGDRDVSKGKGLNKSDYREECFKYLGLRQSFKSNYVFKKKDMIFIVVDGAKEFATANNGYYKQNSLNWLDEKLVRYKNKKVVILQHFPLVDSDVHEKNTYKSQMYKDLLEKHDNVLAIITGHFGANQEDFLNNIQHFIAPSLSTTSSYKIFDIPESKDFVYSQLRRVE